MTMTQLIEKYGSQENVAKQLDISESYISKIVNKRRMVTLPLLRIIARSENLKLWEVVKAHEEANSI